MSSRGAGPGHHAAADQAGAVERDLLRHRNASGRHDAVFGEGAEEHQLLHRARRREAGSRRRTPPPSGLRQDTARTGSAGRARNKSSARNAGSTTARRGRRPSGHVHRGPISFDASRRPRGPSTDRQRIRASDPSITSRSVWHSPAARMRTSTSPPRPARHHRLDRHRRPDAVSTAARARIMAGVRSGSGTGRLVRRRGPAARQELRIIASIMAIASA